MIQSGVDEHTGVIPGSRLHSDGLMHCTTTMSRSRVLDLQHSLGSKILLTKFRARRLLLPGG